MIVVVIAAFPVPPDIMAGEEQVARIRHSTHDWHDRGILRIS